MKVLLLGGTVFLGRHTVHEALAAGHEVTLFHRGTGGCELFPEVEHIHGDRTKDLDKLAGRTWDAVIDTCGYLPGVVEASAKALAGSVSHYTFVSSISVYTDFKEGPREDASPTHVLEDPTVTEVNMETYGGLKKLCEEVAERAMPGRVLHARAGLIVGSHDQSDRFTYWNRRVSMGGRVLVPAGPDRPMQLVHARDLGKWFLHAAEHGVVGEMNATGPAEPFTMETVLAACRSVSGSKAEWVWAPEDLLVDHDAAWWSELPLCMDRENQGVMQADVTRAVKSGLTFRPLEDIAREVLAWDAYRPVGTQLKAGLTPEREAKLLAAVDAQR